MNLIAKLLPAANVVVGLEASSKKRAFEQAGLLFENNHGIARSTVFDSLFAREKLGSTGLGQGIDKSLGVAPGFVHLAMVFIGKLRAQGTHGVTDVLVLVGSVLHKTYLSKVKIEKFSQPKRPSF